ncbi:hypothetical protein GGR58DRAFT_79560 [Xylaria digitata]|nr:hypothetical protein GGR58DRAFT_79560 [Xylaria digitata]
MAASQFGVLTPLQHYNQQQQQQQQQQNSQQQQQYSQLAFQQNPQPSLPPPPHPPPSHQHQQPQQQHASPTTIQSTTNYTPNGNIHPHLQSGPQSPALNGVTAGPLQSRQLQNMTPIPAPPASSGPNTTPANANPSSTAATTATPSSTDLPNSQRRRRPASRPSKRRRNDNDHDGEPALSSPVVPSRPPTVHPFSKGPYNTLEDAIFSLQLHVFTSGYGVSQKRTVKEKLPSGKYDPDGDIIRKDFACDKGGNEFVSQSRGERRRESKKCGCPWKAAIRRLRREGDRWFIEILETQHNHPVTSPDEMHTLASYRRWQRENNAGIRSAIGRLTRAAAMPARDIAAYLKGSIQDHDLDRIDKQILRALSMNDKEVPGSEKEGGSVVFEMVARRPVIILQDNDRTPSTITNGYSSASNPPPAPVNSFPNLTSSMAAFNESPVTYRHTFASTFTNPTNPPPPSMGGVDGTTNMHSEYPAVP